MRPSISMLLVVALACAEARSQQARPRPGQPAPAGPASGAMESRWVDSMSVGCTFGSLDFVDVDATPAGKRTAFDAIPPQVAFEIWLEGFQPRSLTIPPAEGAADAAPTKKPVVSVLRVSNREIDEYLQAILPIVPPGDESGFQLLLLRQIFEQKARLLYHRDDLADVEKRAEIAIEKLKRGAAFKDVMRVHTEDDTSREADGLYTNEARSGLVAKYPMAKVMFELKPGEVTGPIYNKDAAYIVRLDRLEPSENRWFDRERSSSVTIKYQNVPPSGRTIGRMMSSLRVRTDQERFKRMMPPAMQWPPPTAFGPNDLAPAGAPDTPLRRRNLLDDRDNLPFGPVIPPPPDPLAPRGGGR
jgi:hypothetical protein